MGRIALVLTLFFSFCFGYSQKYLDAIAQGKEQKKMVVAIVTTEYCPYCIRMKKKVLGDEEVKKEMEKFVFVELDRDNDKFPDELYVKFVPTTFVIDPNTESITNEAIGYTEKGQFINFLKD